MPSGLFFDPLTHFHHCSHAVYLRATSPTKIMGNTDTTCWFILPIRAGSFCPRDESHEVEESCNSKTCCNLHLLVSSLFHVLRRGKIYQCEDSRGQRRREACIAWAQRLSQEPEKQLTDYFWNLDLLFVTGTFGSLQAWFNHLNSISTILNPEPSNFKSSTTAQG